MALNRLAVVAALLAVFAGQVGARALPEAAVSTLKVVFPGYVPDSSLTSPVAKPQVTQVGGRRSWAAPLELAYKDRDKAYDLSLGQQVRISLRYNPKAGNVWSVEAAGEPTLKALGIENGDQVQIISFQAVAAGSGDVKLKYKGADYAFNATFNVRAK